MHARGGELELDSPLFCHPPFVLFAALVVEYLKVHCKPFVFEAMHDCVIGCQLVRVLSRVEGLDKDHVQRVVGNHHVLVAAPRSERESSCIVGVQLAVMEDADVEFVCGCAVRRGCSFIPGRLEWLLCAVACPSELVVDTRCARSEVGIACLLWLCTRGSRPLAFLDQVAFDCLVRGGRKALCVGKGQTREGGEVGCLNRPELCAPNWVPSCSMEVDDKCFNRWKAVCTEGVERRFLLWVVVWEGRDGHEVRFEGDAPHLAPP